MVVMPTTTATTTMTVMTTLLFLLSSQNHKSVSVNVWGFRIDFGDILPKVYELIKNALVLLKSTQI